MNNNPKIGFCVIQHPLEIGAGSSQEYLKAVKDEFTRNSITFIPFEKIIDNDTSSIEAGTYFKEQNIDVLVAIQSTWSNDYHIVDILEYVAVPVVLWAVPGMENGSLCGIHQLGVVLFEIEKKYKIFYGEIKDKKIQEEIISFCRASALKNFLRRQKIGLIGYRVNGMTEVTFDEFELKRKFGPRVIHFGINTLLEAAFAISKNEAAKVWDSIKTIIKTIRVPDSYGFEVCKKYIALKRIAEANEMSSFAIECYPDLMGQVCLASSILAERDGIIVACEGDVNSALAMLMLYYLTGEPIHNTDLLNPDSNNSVVFSHCGSGAFSIAKDCTFIELCPVRLKESGVSVIFLPKLGDITLVNIVGRKETYRISAIEAYSQETKMVFPGNPVSARFSISTEKYLDLIAKNAIGHHWMIGYGKVLKELKYFSELIDVKFIDLK